MQRKTMNTSGTAKRSVLIAACLMVMGGLVAQEKATVYLSLKRGNVTISGGKLKKDTYKWSGTTWTKLTADENINYSNTYEIGMWDSGQNPTSVTPAGVTTVNDGRVNIVNVSDAELSAISNWDSEAATVRSGYSSSNRIDIEIASGKTLNIVLNNCWSTYQNGSNPGIKISPKAATNSTKLRIGLKGDNRFTNIHVYSSLEQSTTGVNGAAQQQDLSITEFYDASGNSMGTLVADAFGNYASAIGAHDDQRSNDLVFTSGTFFAGTSADVNSTGIGGGGNNPGTIHINGGTVTAVNSSSGASIGGGMGGGNRGGNGHVTITGGTIYAYNWGSSSTCHGLGTAIGGGSTGNTAGGEAYVTISGGTVYAQSNYGPAIGGGSSTCSDAANHVGNNTPGNAAVSISGTANVTAKTMNLVELNYQVNKKADGSGEWVDKTKTDIYPVSIGGGWNVSTKLDEEDKRKAVGTTIPGGNLSFTMSGGILNTGSLVGGRNVFQTTYHGLSTYDISGGTIKGQFLQWQAANHDGTSYFRMTGGQIIGKYDCLYAENDGVVWCQRGTGEITISGGSISGANAFRSTDPLGTAGVGGDDFDGSGGAISIMRGTLNLNGGTITGCTATNRGGAVYCGDKDGAFGSVTINVGQTGSNPLIVRGNTVNGVANDIYLNTDQKINVVGDAFNPQDVGIYTESGTDDPIAVLTTDTPARLTTLWNAINAGTKNLFPDRTEYKVKPYTGSGDLYFYKNNDSPWSAEQKTVGATDLRLVNSVYEISNVKELTAFLWYVNNIDTHYSFDANAHPEANGKLTADIDMSGHYWVPIGTNYTGTFDGNGYAIKNLKMARTNPSAGRGLFGTVSTGTIKNVQLVGCDFYDYQSGIGTTYMGCIVAQMTGTGATLMNSVANGTLKTTNPSGVMGGLAGNNGGSIHSSFASATLNGYTMGGLVGNNSSNLKNSFANAKFASSGEGYVGGLVGVNSGTVENCYVREQSGSSHGSSFGWCVGDNSGTIAYCYIPADETVYKAHGTAQANTCTTYGTTQTPYLYKHADNQMAANANNSHIENGIMGNDRELKGLLATLNNWVDANSGFTPWMRTCASPINGDYPLLKQPNACCVGSPDNINLEYNTDFNTLFDNYVASNNGSGGGTVYLYKTPAVITSGTQENVNVSNSGKATKLYIGESVALKPASGTDDINAYVGITLDNTAGSEGSNPTWGGGDAIDWHMFATPLAAAPLGVNYVKNDLTTPDNTRYDFSWEHPASPTTMPYYRFYPEGNANHGYFPSMEYGWAASNSFAYNGANTSANGSGNWYNDWDYYCYYEPDAHWINFKRNGESHWVEPENPDHTHPHIDYQATPSATPNENEATLVRGKGYLVATAEPTYLQCSGTLNVGDVSLSLTANGYYRTGYNLLGNPYQSYLDFNLFAESNSGDGKIWAGAADAYYFILDEDQGGYTKYAYDASANTYTAPRCLHPHQGFMVVAQGAATAAFTEDMRITTATAVTFRDAATIQPAYPLVNLIATDDSGNRDVCTIELDRPDHGGAGILRELRICKGLVYCHYDDTDYSIAFTRPGLTEAAIRFETIEDSEFTFTWDTQNGDFHYLHLIDNMTGTDIDCLASNEYKFTSRTSDYASRFRLVFDYTGIDEPEVPKPVEGPTSFAFVIGDQMVVNGEGTLQIIDMQGRIIETATLVGPQTTLPVPTTAGLYVLRLNSENGTRTQKIVIR